MSRLAAGRPAFPVPKGRGKLAGGADAILVPISGGYRLEAAIPIARMLGAGDEVGLDIRITDAGPGGGQLSWSDTTHQQDDDTSRFGVFHLTDPLQVTAALRGAPVIDAFEEHAWKHAPEIATDRFVLGTTGATAFVKVLWDEGSIG